LNLRPHGPEPCALAELRYAPNFVRVSVLSCRVKAANAADYNRFSMALQARI
jgi:hypothetical protein